MLMIRFQRIGRTNDAAFRIVVIDKERAAKAGAIVEQVGTYNPHTKSMTLKEESVQAWVAKGAQLSDSVKNLLITKKVMEGKKAAVVSKKNLEKNKAKQEEAAAAEKAAQEAAAAAPAEAPAEAPAAEEPAAVEEAPVESAPAEEAAPAPAE